MTRAEHRTSAVVLLDRMKELAKEYQDKDVHVQMMPILTWMATVAQVHATLSLESDDS